MKTNKKGQLRMGHKVISGVALLFTAFFITSCQKEDIVTNQQDAHQVTVEGSKQVTSFTVTVENVSTPG